MNLGKRLTELRKSAHLTQDKVSSEIGVGRSAYAYYETGQSEPKIATLKKLASLYNISVDSLVADGVASPEVDFVPSKTVSNSFNELTEYEQAIVLKTRMLSKDKKIELMDIINNL